MKRSMVIFGPSALLNMAMRLFASAAAATLFGLLVGEAFASPAEQADYTITKRIISTIPRPLPDASCVRQESIGWVLGQVVSIGLKQHPQCQDYRIESRKFVAPENVVGEFEELWVVEMCGKKINFEITRKQFGNRRFAISVHAIP